jgi:acetylornithine deacetylase/succinyl-diaminopimelate desuccinylase-like protein
MRGPIATIGEANLIEWTQRFVRHPSQQTALFEREPEIQAFIGECVAPLVTGLNLPMRRDAMGNLLVEMGPREAEQSLLLMTYAMTHPAAAMNNPFGGELLDTPRGQAVRGRGVSEQKGPLAAALTATAAAYRAGGLRGRLIFAVSTAGETGRHDAAASILAALGRVPKVGIVAVGTSNRIALGNKGRQDITVRILGKTAHSGMPWDGVNAIEGLRQVLDQLARLVPAGAPHPGLGKVTLTPTFIETRPCATHTVQSEAILTLDRRLLPGQSPELALAEVRQALHLPPPWRLEIEAGPFMYPAEIDPEGLLVRSARDGCRDAGLPEPVTFWCSGALDAGYLCQVGCEAAMWGPGPTESWHSAEEQILVEELCAGAAAYFATIRKHLM